MQEDHPEYNELVRFASWRCLLLDYLDKEPHPDTKA